MSFVLWTLWFIIIAVVVNVVMERVWDRIPPLRLDERGSIDLEPDDQPRHRR